MKKIILASRSPRRIELLKMITENFEVCPSAFDEETIKADCPKELVEKLSFHKANAIKENYKDEIIIGSDTVVAIDGKILGIPKNKAQARDMILMLSGKTHSVLTGVTILSGEKAVTLHCETRVTFFKLTENEIEDYINSDEPYDKAGGYGIQQKGGLFVERIDGSYFNVVGFPIAQIKRELEKFIKQQ